MCLVTTIVIVILFHDFDIWPSAWGSPEMLEIRKCKWTESDPAIFSMRTKTNVFYDAGQWYHMTENFLIQHSILREKNALASASQVFFNFDEGTVFVNN